MDVRRVLQPMWARHYELCSEPIDYNDVSEEFLDEYEMTCEVCGVVGWAWEAPHFIDYWNGSAGYGSYLWAGIHKDHSLPDVLCRPCAKRLEPLYVAARDIQECTTFNNKLKRAINERIKNHRATSGNACQCG